MPQLDALRALAILAVMLSHFSRTIQASRLDLGGIGVRLFFVLSGFFITRILLDCRERIASGTSTAGRQFRQFYLRRTLRIFPAFYATLFLATILDMGSARATFWWHVCYGSNILFALQGTWGDILSHFWSLAVEEQFYLLWPWLILFLPAARLPLALVIGCAAGPGARLITHALAPDNATAATVLVPACLDQLLLGAVLAWLWHTRGPAAALPRRFRQLGLVVLLVGVPLQLAFFSGTTIASILAPLVQSIAFVVLIDGAARGIGGRLGKALSWKPLVWMGGISYGLYLLHNFSHWWAPRILRQLTGYRLSYFSNELAQISYLIALTFGAAVVSYYVIERPINRLKHRLSYVEPTGQTA